MNRFDIGSVITACKMSHNVVPRPTSPVLLFWILRQWNLESRFSGML